MNINTKKVMVLSGKLILYFVCSSIFLILFSQASQYMYSQTFLEKTVPAEEDKFARNHIELIMQKNYDEAEKQVANQFRTQENRANLEKMGEIFSQRVPTAGLELVGYVFHLSATSGQKMTELSYLLRYDDLWRTITIAVNNENGKLDIYGLQSKAISESIIDENKINLTKKSPLHYIVLFLTIATCLRLFFLQQRHALV